MQIRKLNSTAQHFIPALSTLLMEAVLHGASIGFLRTTTESEAHAYWSKVFASLQEDGLSLWVAAAGDRLLGTVQLERCAKANGRHRAEIQKLIVATAARRQGVSTALMHAAEAFAVASGVSLLVLDTQVGSAAEAVYQKLGWQRAGEIPDYAASPDGLLHATVYYFKLLRTGSVAPAAPNYVDAARAGLSIRATGDVAEALNACVGFDGLLLTPAELSPAFFQLGSGLAGELFQKFINYRLALAIVLPDSSVYSRRFQELVYEHRRHNLIRFVSTRAEAETFLRGLAGSRTTPQDRQS